MEQSIRTQPPGPRRRKPAGAAEAAVPSPAAPAEPGGPSAGTGERRSVRPNERTGERAGERDRDRERVGGPTAPLRLRLRLPFGPAAREQRRGGSGRPARLTAVGTGVLAVGGTLAVAAVDRLLFDGLGVLFGLGYVVVCFQVAVRVRPADLPAAPISGPIAFALALLLLGPVSASGITAQVVALASGLALRAGWLFTGTALAAAIVAARFVAQRRFRRGRQIS
ncbi:DUF6542 domain-containing protein [Kitasatospora sp. MMS16-BH015]|uniref:DUF6542 domain-containing protein n=1 Tax=Kitasatospora sp. MMS16-BH015 TaxID=2018025 RepID=UPI00131A4ED9|nr:DUF6542 domain-containing protein [Kitasatospora sp. MMS16-BH015]